VLVGRRVAPGLLRTHVKSYRPFTPSLHTVRCRVACQIVGTSISVGLVMIWLLYPCFVTKPEVTLQPLAPQSCIPNRSFHPGLQSQRHPETFGRWGTSGQI
jgi:hypothetical protein